MENVNDRDWPKRGGRGEGKKTERRRTPGEKHRESGSHSGTVMRGGAPQRLGRDVEESWPGGSEAVQMGGWSPGLCGGQGVSQLRGPCEEGFQKVPRKATSPPISLASWSSVPQGPGTSRKQGPAQGLCLSQPRPGVGHRCGVQRSRPQLWLQVDQGLWGELGGLTFPSLPSASGFGVRQVCRAL